MAIEDFQFKNLVELTDREIQLVLREIDFRDLSIALIRARKGLKDRIFSNMSSRVGTMLTEEIEAKRGALKEEVEGSRERIVKTVHKLMKKGQAGWPRSSKELVKRKPLGKDYLAMKRALKKLIQKPISDLSQIEITRMFTSFGEVARKEGILELAKFESVMKDDFISTGVRLAVDGTEPELIQDILQKWMQSLMHDHEVKFQKVIAGMLSVQSGDNPRITEQKLNVMY